MERLKDAVEMRGRQSRSRIRNRNEHDIAVNPGRTDQQLSLSLGQLTHRLNRVEYQVDRDLLQFDTISNDIGQVLCEIGSYQDGVPCCFSPGEFDHFTDDAIDRQDVLLWRGLLDEISNSPNDLACPNSVLLDAGERPSDVL